jgi:hypothetical protein
MKRKITKYNKDQQNKHNKSVEKIIKKAAKKAEALLRKDKKIILTPSLY